jgi:hypothetical protein
MIVQNKTTDKSVEEIIWQHYRATWHHHTTVLEVLHDAMMWCNAISYKWCDSCVCGGYGVVVQHSGVGWSGVAAQCRVVSEQCNSVTATPLLHSFTPSLDSPWPPCCWWCAVPRARPVLRISSSASVKAERWYQLEERGRGWGHRMGNMESYLEGVQRVSRSDENSGPASEWVCEWVTNKRARSKQ